MYKNKVKSQKSEVKSLRQNSKVFKNFLLFTCTFTFLLLLPTCGQKAFYLQCFAQDGFHYDDKGKRNPFIPLVTLGGRLLNLDQEEGVKALSLEGVIYDKNGRSMAIVNGEVVSVGDEVSQYRILKIEEDRVIFIKDGEPLEIELDKEGQ